MSTIKTTMTADASAMLAEQKKVAQGAATISNEYRDLTNEHQRLGTVAAQAWRSTRTPLEAYNNKIGELSKALAKGRIDQDTYNRAVSQAKDKLDAASNSGSRLGSVIMDIGAKAGGLMSLASLFQSLAASIADTRKQAEDAAESLKDRFVSRGELAQVYGTLAEADTVSNAFRQRGGAATGQIADQNAFAIQSAGLLKDLPTFLAAGGSGLVGSEKMAELIGAMTSLQKAMTPQETGGSEAILSKALVASAASKVEVSRLLQAASKSGIGAKAVGFGDEETLAAVAVATDPLGSPETADERMRALFAAIEKGGIKSATLSGAIQQIRAKRSAGIGFNDIFGGSESQAAVEAYRVLDSNFDTFTTVSRDINAANSGQVFRDKLTMMAGDAKQRSLMTDRGAGAAIELAREDVGRREMLTNNLINLQDSLMEQRGANSYARWLSRTAQNSSLPFLDPRLDPNFSGSLVSQRDIAAARQQATAAGDAKLIATLDKIVETQVELTQLIREQRGNRRPTVPTPER
jgi:hypothetical protein